VLDLGCAPGSWSQYLIKERLNFSKETTKLVGVDLLKMQPLEHCHFIHGFMK